LNGKGGREREHTGGAHGVVAASKAVRDTGGGRSGADLSGRVARFCEETMIKEVSGFRSLFRYRIRKTHERRIAVPG
jgi:hypothetical protein